MKQFYQSLLVGIFFILTSNLFAQTNVICPIYAGVDQSICVPNCATLTGTFVPTYQTTGYSTSVIPYAPDPSAGTAVVVSDDQWSGVIPIPFTFCFYGVAYNQLLIGSNGNITFDLTQANLYDQWPIGAAMPTNLDPMNTINGPWQDLYPPGGGTITYATFGAAPCRRFVATWENVPMYGCFSTLCTQQLVLYETTNIIENFIGAKPICATWNGGYAIQALQNSTGTSAVVYAGRNYPANWAAANEGMRYTPNGPATYTIGWYQGVTLIASTASTVVCPTSTTVYTFKEVSTNCDGVQVTVSDPMTVTTSSLTVSGSQTNIICFGGTGSATVTVVSGSGPFTYAWTPSGGTAATASGLLAGTYTCTVTGAGGCQGTQTFTITQNPQITATQSQVNVTCFGACNGSASVVASGGTGVYTYSWAPSGGTAATASGLCAGTYTCTISSPVGCSITKIFTITQPPVITATTSQVNVTCFGTCTGSATVVASGGTGVYTYAWSPSGGTAATASGLCAGTYTCTISSPAGCSITQSFNITQPPVITATQSQVNITCFGSCNGSATVVASGGTGVYTYSWAPSGGTAATASGLCAGTYTCTISSPAGCSITKIFTITQPPAITATTSQVNVTCFGSCTGSATVVASGGTGVYTYAWAPSGGTAATASGLCAGTYTCTISSPAGCSITQSFNITQPPAITATQSQVNVTCFGACNGSATVVASGGTGVYTYSWAPSGGTAATASGLCAGTYTCTISSPVGCSITKIFTITQPPAITATTSQVNVTCFGSCTGSATVVAAGGTGVYTYAWAPSGGTAATASGLCAGTYTCTISSPAGCSITQSFNITQPPVITATQSQVNITCFGSCTGSATVVASGGTGVYTYSWAPSGGTAATASGLCAGTYTCTISSPAGCSITKIFTITQPPAITATQSQVNVSCFGACNGSATVVASGGTGIYSYAWAPSGGTSATATGLCAGTYTCTISSPVGCSITKIFTITQPPVITATSSSIQATCGNPNGSATIIPSGGVGPYTYSWAPSGGTASTATGLSAGSYTCTITDANGCTFTQTISITNAGSPTATISASTNVTCFAGNTGSATVLASGGTGPYTYAWAPSGGIGASASSLIAGTYTVTVTDANGCATIATVTITQPPVITATTSQVNVSCFGSCNGSATVVASGGTGIYTYAWAPSGGTAATAFGLCAGTYTCTISSPIGCSITKSFTITQPPIITATTSQVNVTCFGVCNGSASVVASGGTGIYTYAWAPAGGTSATATGLCAGTYTCTISSPIGCSITKTFTITQPPIITATVTTVQALCGNPNGSATVVPSGGVGPYTYSWAPSGGTAATATGLAAGSYTCTITDANGCTFTQTVSITNAGSPTASISASTNITCFAGNSGSATVSASGGTGPYTYSWSPSGGTGATASSLIAGSYTVTVTDANGCSTTASVVLTQPPVISATSSQLNVNCNASCNGSATVVASGGTGTYTYAWAPSGGTAATATGLCAGTYTCTISSPAGCILTQSFTITQPTAVTATISTTPVLCNGGSTGTASVVPSGGVGPYAYSWAPSGGTSATASGLSAGTYTCTITDANGCVITKTITVTQPTPIACTATTVQAICGNPNGSATVTPNGGIGPYTYSWTPSGGTAATATGLAAGSYTCTITDANGCTFTQTVMITNAGSPSATITASTNILCFGGNNGSATVTASGGTGPYSYAWSPSGGTGAAATSLIAGSYTVTVTDANGCSVTASVLLTQPPVLSATASSSPVLCNAGNTGSATVVATGGAPVYTYNWAPSGGTGTTATSLIAGTYTCTITDANGCTTTATAIVTQPSAVTSTISTTPVLCNGGSTGTAFVVPSGGVGPYAYSWAPSGGTSATASGLSAGTYTCTITDANGCVITKTITVTQPTPIACTATTVQAICGNPNGSATVTPNGGIGPYTYSWTPSGGTAATATGLAAGSYTCTITDANGCTFTQTVTITNAGSPTATISTSTNVLCFGGNNGSSTVTASGGTGPYTYSWSPSGGTAATANSLIAGSYTATVTDANGCTATASVVLTQPPALTATASSTPVLCNGGNTGSATVIAIGGAPAYSYNWAPSGGTAAIANSLIAGSYTCTITDANGCITTASITVTQPTQLTASISTTPVLCNGGNTGTATVVASNATPGYTYSWLPSGGNAANASGLSAGSYTCTITDANSCSITASIIVTAPTAVTNVTSFTQSTCGNANGQASVVSSGGTPGYTYLWSPTGGTAATATGLLANTYTVTVTDANGCVSTASVSLPNAGTPIATITSSTNVLCFGGNNGDATVTVTGAGTPPYTYAWSPSGGTGSTGTNLVAGSFTVTVNDANGCSATASIIITEPPLLTGTASFSPVLCNAGNTGSATVIAAGGASTYTYSWSPSGGSNATANTLTAGSYTCTITDANGCTTTASTTVTEPTQVTTTFSQVDELCNGGNTASANVVPSGGTGIYTYSWAPSGGSGSTASGLVAGTYTCTIADANGCFITQSFTITEPTLLVATATGVDAHCNLADGSASVSSVGGTGVASYVWSLPANGPTISNVLSGTYTVTATDANGCTASTTITINNLNGVVASVSSVTNVACFGQSTGQIVVTQSGGNPAYTYSWTPNVSTTSTAANIPIGNYQVIVTDANGCTSTVSTTITQPPLLTITASAAPNSVCSGSSVQLTATPAGGTPATAVVWMPGNLNGTNQNIIPSATTTYSATVTDANGCTATATTNVTVFPMPTPVFVSDITSGCAPVCVNYTDMSSVTAPGQITAWTWDFGDGNTSTSQNPSHCYPIAGQYTVILTVKTADGCTNIITMTNYIDVYANPVAAFGASPQPTSLIDPQVFFTDSSTNVSSWLWSFGDVQNSSSTLQNPSFTYSTPECFAVILTVTSPDGCVDTVSHPVCIDPDITIYVPNAFTPNGDNRNETFIPQGLGIDPDSFEMWIFDRWGNMIFYTADFYKGWDGRVQGQQEISQTDTYVWKINVKDLTGTSHNMIGHVSLIK